MHHFFNFEIMPILLIFQPIFHVHEYHAMNKKELTDRDKRRFIKQIQLDEIGESGQHKIKSARVLVVGAGGLGSPVLQYLTAAGVGNLGVIDYDYVKEENLQRQILYGNSDLGKLKTIITKKKLEELSANINFDIRNIRLNQGNVLGFIEKYDIIIDATDNYSTKFLLNDACIYLDKVYIFGAIHKWAGQVSVFNYQGGPSLRCVFPSRPDDQDKSESGIIGTVPAITGLMQANEAIKVILESHHVLSNKLLVYNLLNHFISFFTINKNPDNFNIELFK